MKILLEKKETFYFFAIFLTCDRVPDGSVHFCLTGLPACNWCAFDQFFYALMAVIVHHCLLCCGSTAMFATTAVAIAPILLLLLLSSNDRMDFECLQTNDALVAPLLRLKDNSCHIDESERVLKDAHKYSELVILYEKKGLHSKGWSAVLAKYELYKYNL